MKQTAFPVAGLVLMVTVACGPPAGPEPITPAPSSWVVSWAAATYRAGPLARDSVFERGLHDQTVRNVVRLSVGGSQVRVRVSNRVGDRALSFDAVSIGLGAGGAALDVTRSYPLTFEGRAEVTIPAGAHAVSDAVALPVDAGDDLLVSLFASEATGPVTGHRGGGQSVYLSVAGDHTMAAAPAAFPEQALGWLFLEAVDVLAPPNVRGAIVALGDSTTIGAASTPDENRRWTDVVARRLANRVEGEPTFSIVNVAISGNRVLTDSPCFGESALARFERDALGQTGVVAVVVLEGINDLGHPDGLATASDRFRPCVTAPVVSVDDMTAAYRDLVATARARGVPTYGGTILPYGGNQVWTRNAEAERQAINRAILSGQLFDGAIDFDAALADPEDRVRLAPAFDSGDGLHPTDAGYQAMGDVFDLSLFDPLLTRAR